MQNLTDASDDEPVEKRARKTRSKLAKERLDKEEMSPSITDERKVLRKRACATKARKQNEAIMKENKETCDSPINKEEELDLPPPGLSEYEIMIQQNIAAKKKFLDSLEIFKTKGEVDALKSQPVKKPTYRGIAKQQKSPEPVVIRRSLRQQNLTPDGLNLPLPSEKDIARADAAADIISHPRPPPGPAPLLDYYKSHNKEESKNFINDMKRLSVSGGDSVWSGNIKSVLQTMKKMKITEDLVAKVVPQRTFAVKIHPTIDKALVLVGGKWGELGIWDVERDDATSGAYYFTSHSRPINCITVDPWKPEYIYTTSYDGSLRRTNLMAGIVQQVYSYVDEEIYSKYISWHSHVDENTILVSASHGQIIHVDLRAEAKATRQYFVHNQKSVKVVTVHPTRVEYFATASRDGNVCLWDMRHHRKNIPVTSFSHGRNVTGLEFSPLTGNFLISTCMDNHLRFISCDLTNITVERKIQHNNQTGRWLTTFRAHYVPCREDLIVVGSLMQPRRVEVWGCDGELKHEFMGECLGSVSSVTALHPTQPILAGCNSSGKAQVFK